jgi:hypothetical protein
MKNVLRRSELDHFLGSPRAAVLVTMGRRYARSVTSAGPCLSSGLHVSWRRGSSGAGTPRLARRWRCSGFAPRCWPRKLPYCLPAGNLRQPPIEEEDARLSPSAWLLNAAVNAYAPVVCPLGSDRPPPVELIDDFFTGVLRSGHCVERKLLNLPPRSILKPEMAVWSEGAVVAWYFGPLPVASEFSRTAQNARMLMTG